MASLSLILLLYSLAIIIAALYVYATRKFTYWVKCGVPYEHPQAFVGNLKDVALQRTHIAFYLQDLYRRRKNKPYVGIFAFASPVLVVHDLDLVKKILVKDSQVFINRNITVDPEKDPLSYRNIFGLKGQKWKHMRNHLTPNFTSGKMKKMFYLVDNTAQELVKYMDNLADKGEVMDVKDTMAKFTTDVIATCAFGIESNSLKNPNSEFRRHLFKIFQLSGLKMLGVLFAFFAPELMNLFRIRIVDFEVTEFMRNLVWSTVEHREKHGIVRKDFLDGMMELRKKYKETQEQQEHKFDFDGDDFVAQAFAFLAAGFETSSTTMSFALYELALHPEIQSRLRTEIREILKQHNNEVTYEGMQEMKYLDMVVSETLRKYPAIPFLDRVSETDYELPRMQGDPEPVILRKDTPVFIPVYAIQYDPEHYPNPEKFDPERFTEENKQNRLQYTYMPFGEGPRICIGMRFGLMQVKVGLIHILSRYEVAPCKDTPVPLPFDNTFLITPGVAIPLSVTRASEM